MYSYLLYCYLHFHHNWLSSYSRCLPSLLVFVSFLQSLLVFVFFLQFLLVFASFLQSLLVFVSFLQSLLIFASFLQSLLVFNPFSVLHFSYYTLMTFVIILSVILLPMLIALLSTRSLIRHLIFGNN